MTWRGWWSAASPWLRPPGTWSVAGKSAGPSLSMLTHVGTMDATNSFKAYSTQFVRQVGIDSRHGFEVGIELTAKARRMRLPVAEIPTIWLERQAGVSNFKLASWIPKYLRWYRFAFGPRLPPSRSAPGHPGAGSPRGRAREGLMMEKVLVSG